MDRWDYKVFTARGPGLEKTLKDLGAQGWELLSMTPSSPPGSGPSEYLVVLKQRKQAVWEYKRLKVKEAELERVLSSGFQQGWEILNIVAGSAQIQLQAGTSHTSEYLIFLRRHPSRR